MHQPSSLNCLILSISFPPIVTFITRTSLFTLALQLLFSSSFTPRSKHRNCNCFPLAVFYLLLYSRQNKKHFLLYLMKVLLLQYLLCSFLFLDLSLTLALFDQPKLQNPGIASSALYAAFERCSCLLAPQTNRTPLPIFLVR